MANYAINYLHLKSSGRQAKKRCSINYVYRSLYMCKGNISSQETEGGKNSLKINPQTIRLPELDFVS
jgi:hypothetical protein